MRLRGGVFEAMESRGGVSFTESPKIRSGGTTVEGLAPVQLSSCGHNKLPLLPPPPPLTPSQARVEHLEQAGGQSVISMARLSSLMFLNLVVDGYMVVYCLDSFSVDRPNVLILFAFGGFPPLVSFLPRADCLASSLLSGCLRRCDLLMNMTAVFRFFFLFFFSCDEKKILQNISAVVPLQKEKTTHRASVGQNGNPTGAL